MKVHQLAAHFRGVANAFQIACVMFAKLDNTALFAARLDDKPKMFETRIDAFAY